MGIGDLVGRDEGRAHRAERVGALRPQPLAVAALAAPEIEAYVSTGEWRDKAGGYAIQESADRFVTALEGGGFDNVVGLPVARALALLRLAGACLAG